MRTMCGWKFPKQVRTFRMFTFAYCPRSDQHFIVTFLNITDPYNMEPTPEPEYRPASTPIIVPQLEERPSETYFNMPFDQAPGLEALSTAATSNFHYIRPLSVPVPSPSDTHASPHSSNNLNFILNPTRPETPHGI